MTKNANEPRIIADPAVPAVYDGNNPLHVHLACIRNGLAVALHAEPASEDVKEAQRSLQALMTMARMR